MFISSRSDGNRFRGSSSAEEYAYLACLQRGAPFPDYAGDDARASVLAQLMALGRDIPGGESWVAWRNGRGVEPNPRTLRLVRDTLQGLNPVYVNPIHPSAVIEISCQLIQEIDTFSSSIRYFQSLHALLAQTDARSVEMLEDKELAEAMETWAMAGTGFALSDLMANLASILGDFAREADLEHDANAARVAATLVANAARQQADQPLDHRICCISSLDEYADLAMRLLAQAIDQQCRRITGNWGSLRYFAGPLMIHDSEVAARSARWRQCLKEWRTRYRRQALEPLAGDLGKLPAALVSGW